MVLHFLPELPDGVDLFDDDVQVILTKLRTDAGVVVGRSKALTDACDRVEELKQQVSDSI